jgi:hypothetical protein
VERQLRVKQNTKIIDNGTRTLPKPGAANYTVREYRLLVTRELQE